MKKRIFCAFFALLIAAAGLALPASAAKQLDKINITLNTDIAGLNYKDYNRIFSIDNEGFEFIVSPMVGSAMTAVHDFRSYKDNFRVGETYQLTVQFSFPLDYEFSDGFAVCVNGQELEPEQYTMFGSPEMGLGKLTVYCDVTVTESTDEGFFSRVFNAIAAFLGKIADTVKTYFLMIVNLF